MGLNQSWNGELCEHMDKIYDQGLKLALQIYILSKSWEAMRIVNKHLKNDGRGSSSRKKNVLLSSNALFL